MRNYLVHSNRIFRPSRGRTFGRSWRWLPGCLSFSRTPYEDTFMAAVCWSSADRWKDFQSRHGRHLRHSHWKEFRLVTRSSSRHRDSIFDLLFGFYDEHRNNFLTCYHSGCVISTSKFLHPCSWAGKAVRIFSFDVKGRHLSWEG